MVGGVMATILPDEILEATGLYPHLGLLDKPNILDNDDDRIIDNLPLDYSILDEIDYIYPPSNAYFVHTTRACSNKCSFCAVSKLELNYFNCRRLKENIDYTNKLFGYKKNLLIIDKIDEYMKLKNIKLRKSREQKRYIDFNQGVEAKLVNHDRMNKLAEMSIRPLRIAFDH